MISDSNDKEKNTYISGNWVRCGCLTSHMILCGLLVGCCLRYSVGLVPFHVA